MNERGNVNESPPIIPLTYSTVEERRAPIALYFIGLALTIVPLVVGVGCLVGYWHSHLDQYATAGFLTLIFGGGSVFIALLLALIYTSLARQATVERELHVRRSRKLLVLIGITFLAAVFCFFMGIRLVQANSTPSNW